MSRSIDGVANHRSGRHVSCNARFRNFGKLWLILLTMGATLALVAGSSSSKVSARSRAGIGSSTRLARRYGKLAAPPALANNVIINEIDSDTPGIDDAEFIELYDGGAGNTSLTGLVLVLFDGSTNSSYNAFDLTGRSTDANGYFVIGSPIVPGVDLAVGFNFLQNGEDAVALYAGSISDFPAGTPISTNNLQDAVVYDTSDPFSPQLAALLNAGQPQVNEDAGSAGDVHSIGRCANGSGGARNTSTYSQGDPSPDGPNNCPVDSDGDGVPDIKDNCVFTANADQADFDKDALGDACDPDDDNDGQSDENEITCGSNPLDAGSLATDTDNDHQPDCVDIDDDNDGVADNIDNCPLNANPDQADADGDGIGNTCDANLNDGPKGDQDGDGVTNNVDNCPNVANAGQADFDKDGLGDACDPDDDNDGVGDANDLCANTAPGTQVNASGCADADGDGVADGSDNCPGKANKDQADLDHDGLGDVCDSDDDNDGVPDANDNCPLIANSDQADNDHDGIGNACDADDDNDGVPDTVDNCPLTANPNQADSDHDGIGDVCDKATGADSDKDGVPNARDNCPLVANPNQADNDHDGIGDACDPDDDNDGVPDNRDNCRFFANREQSDNDHDGVGDVCDPDDDNDGVPDVADNCRSKANPAQTDTDHDGIGDACDPDDDNDGVPDHADNCQFIPNPKQSDMDHDGLGDRCDPDNDNDGVIDSVDNCPFAYNPDQLDTDRDGIGDVCTPYEFPQDGAFVIGDGVNLVGGATVFFWGSQWPQQNPLSGSAAPMGFKGFETDDTALGCGRKWKANTREISDPPKRLPRYMAVIVSSSIQKKDNLISGDIKKFVIVRTNPDYGTRPGQVGTGTVVAVICVGKSRE